MVTGGVNLGVVSCFRDPGSRPPEPYFSAARKQSRNSIRQLQPIERASERRRDRSQIVGKCTAGTNI